MRNDGCASDTAVVAKSPRQRRRREVCRSFTCISPWFIFSRWFNGGKSRASQTKSGRNWGKAKIDPHLDVSSLPGEDFSEIGKEASFDHGVGFGLIYLVRNELNKMIELRTRIESLLQHFKNEDDKHLSAHSRSRISSSLAKTFVHEIIYAEEHYSGQCSSSSDHGFKPEKTSRMDQIEAELEAEFDRLQTDGESQSELNVEQNASDREEVSEVHEFSNEKFCGVSPIDLERRLHEVLELRQQERISELESALEYAMEELEEKETELAFWKDAARFVAQHLPDIAGILIQVKQSMEQEFEARDSGTSLTVLER